MTSDELYAEKLMDLIRIQLQNGTEDPYMMGLTNGIILSLAIYKNEEPEYISAAKAAACKHLFMKRHVDNIDGYEYFCTHCGHTEREGQ